MAKVSFSKIINKSFSYTKKVLFENFSLKKWLKLLLIAFLAGALGSSCNNSSNIGDGFDNQKEAQASIDNEVDDSTYLNQIEEQKNLSSFNDKALCPLPKGGCFKPNYVIFTVVLPFFGIHHPNMNQYMFQ